MSAWVPDVYAYGKEVVKKGQQPWETAREGKSTDLLSELANDG